MAEASIIRTIPAQKKAAPSALRELKAGNSLVFQSLDSANLERLSIVKITKKVSDPTSREPKWRKQGIGRG